MAYKAESKSVADALASMSKLSDEEVDAIFATISTPKEEEEKSEESESEEDLVGLSKSIVEEVDVLTYSEVANRALEFGWEKNFVNASEGLGYATSGQRGGEITPLLSYEAQARVFSQKAYPIAVRLLKRGKRPVPTGYASSIHALWMDGERTPALEKAIKALIGTVRV